MEVPVSLKSLVWSATLTSTTAWLHHCYIDLHSVTSLHGMKDFCPHSMISPPSLSYPKLLHSPRNNMGEGILRNGRGRLEVALCGWKFYWVWKWTVGSSHRKAHQSMGWIQPTEKKGRFFDAFPSPSRPPTHSPLRADLGDLSPPTPWSSISGDIWQARKSHSTDEQPIQFASHIRNWLWIIINASSISINNFKDTYVNSGQPYKWQLSIHITLQTIWEQQRKAQCKIRLQLNVTGYSQLHQRWRINGKLIPGTGI